MDKLVAENTYTPAEELALWKEARVFASQNKSYSIRGRNYTRQDLPLINQMIGQLTAEVNATSGRSTVVIGRHARRV
jgi:hypothetical protein